MTRLEAIGLIAPLAMIAVGFVLPMVCRCSARQAARCTLAGALIAFVVGLTVGGSLLLGRIGVVSPSDADLPVLPGILGIRIDELTAIMLFTISSIGLVVSRFAIRYLDADVAQRRFSTWLAFALAAVLVLVLASNLLVFFAAWVATSHALHQLLTIYGDRPAARMAARKKFVISRMGDAFLAVSFIWIYQTFGTFELAEIFAQAEQLTDAERSSRVLPIAVLIVLGAMTKSAQLPVHSWLPETMEAPTPVSAMMHAGIINAGGFLVIRMSPLIVHAPAALSILAVIGALTAVFGSVVMLTQTDVKKKLAFSTVSQMGFMMLQCGVGAFSAATLHLVGHSFYKAHGFLSAGSWIDPQPPRIRALANEARVGWSDVLASIGMAVGIVLVTLWAYGFDPASKPGLPVLGGILTLGLAQLLIFARQIGPQLPEGLPFWLAGLLPCAVIAVLYFGAVAGFQRMLGESIAQPGAGASSTPWILIIFTLLLFTGALLVQAMKPTGRANSRWARFYVHAHNGFYIGTLQSELVNRLWPVPRTDSQP